MGITGVKVKPMQIARMMGPTRDVEMFRIMVMRIKINMEMEVNSLMVNPYLLVLFMYIENTMEPITPATIRQIPWKAIVVFS